MDSTTQTSSIKGLPVLPIIHLPQIFNTTIFTVDTSELLSSIVSETQAAENFLMGRWKRNYLLYEFKLFIRRSRDGFTNEQFWERLDFIDDDNDEMRRLSSRPLN
ncbi:hypothetical protein C2G38_2167593 [Gigaspora rosea]|uniref:Uncharacterized protein n=1 Tax=Gigaspora rosea TaxID=44941 RepID=A0A397VSS8_9GLOM|nr:hypothetical protein C2G38_2167593 [Gigaspora rosea]